VDDADRGRRGLRARPGPDLFLALREHRGLRVVPGGIDLGGSSSLNLLVGDGDRGLEVRLSGAERAALPLAMARQSLSSIGGWVARLDDLGRWQGAFARPG
jgi:hypothetical protein